MDYIIVKNPEQFKEPSSLERHAVRTGSDIAQGITRAPENISALASLPAKGLHSLLSSIAQSITGHGIPEPEDVYPLPRSSTVESTLQGLAEKRYGPGTNILKPQNVVEDVISRTAQKAPTSLLTSLLTGGGSLLPSLAADVTSSAAGAGLKAAGAPAWAETAGEIAGGLIPGIAKSKILKNTVQKAEEEISPLFAKRDELAKTLPVKAPDVKKEIDPLLHLVETKEKSFSKPLVDFIKDIGNEYSATLPEKTVSDLLATKSLASGFFKQGKNDGKLIGKLTKSLDSLIQDYGKKNKDFMKVYKESNDLYSTIKKSFPEVKSLLNIPQENAPKLTKSIFEKSIPTATLAPALYQVSQGNLPQALKILLGGAGVHFATKYAKNPLNATRILSKSPKIKEIMKQFTKEELKKHPDIAPRLVNQLTQEAESLGILRKPSSEEDFIIVKR